MTTTDLTTEKTVEYYLNLPYQFIITPDDEGFGVKVVGLPGCITHAQKWEEIPAMIHDAMYSWIETSLEYGDPINEPEQTPEI
jgi:predicted RNase H-like HicB family nuclease